MRTLVSSQQAAFFTQNGYIELAGIAFDHQAVFDAARNASLELPLGRDLWRSAQPLQHLLQRKLAPASLALAGKPIRLACDQWISPGFNQPGAFKDFTCIQGLGLIAILCSSEMPIMPRRASALGIPPYPSKLENILFVKPNIVIDWPLLKQGNLYVAAYAFSNLGVYVHNSKDPATHSLKEFGYEFGDILKDASHPIVR